MVCKRRTTDAAITIGSMPDCGREPCEPRPKSLISKLSAGPSRTGAPSYGPGRRGNHVLAENDVRLGKAVEQSVIDHGLGAAAVSSAG